MRNSIQTLPFALIFILSLLLAPNLQAQLHVDAIGEVGIGTSNSSAKLHVYNNTTDRIMYLWHAYSGPNTKYGLYNHVSSAGTGSRYGIYNSVTSNSASSFHVGLSNRNNITSTGFATSYGQYNLTTVNGGSGTRYGIYNYLSCNSGYTGNSASALYSGVNPSCGGYAGYFNGNVYVVGTVTQTSDASKKTNVEPMEGALDLIGKLNAKTYDYIMDENLALPTEKQFGFMAQELETVLPELVKEVDVVTLPDPDDESSQVESAGTIKSVNYTGLIPVLVKGMQEQQATIAQQQTVIQEQQKRLEALEAKINR